MKRILLICAFLLALAVQAGAQSKQQQQQPVEVNGLVVDSDDVPIVGATVYIKDEPGIGSITNSEGRFKLTAKLYNTLAVSFMGVRNRRTDHHFGGRRQDHPPGRQPDGRGRRHRYGYAAQSQRDGRRGGGRHQRPRTARDEYRQHARRPRPGRDFHPVER